MIRKKFSAKQKAQVALDALKNDATVNELSKKHGVHPTQINSWKSNLIAEAEVIFSKGTITSGYDDEKRLAELERKIGQLIIENDFLKKNWSNYTKKSGLK